MEQPDHLMTAANLKKDKPAAEKQQDDCENHNYTALRDYN